MEMFRTIRKTAENGILSEYMLRKMQKEGRLPGIFSGNRFLVDQEELIRMLHSEATRDIN